MASAAEACNALHEIDSPARRALMEWKRDEERINAERYGSDLYSESVESALQIAEVKPLMSPASPEKHGYEILNACFDAAFARYPRLTAMGEDVGRLGDVNQGFAGLQDKYGALRVIGYRHPRNHHRGTGHRPGVARFQADRRDPVSRLPAVCPPDLVG